ncbi:MAG: hypothetical protein ACLFTP_10810 [Rhodosalinus sp.]
MCQMPGSGLAATLAARAQANAYAREAARAAIHAAAIRAWHDATRRGLPVVEVRVHLDRCEVLTVIERPTRIPRTRPRR